MLRKAATVAHHLSALDALSGARFTKAHATGNDFVMLSDPDGSLEITPGAVRALCDRHQGVGGDGLIRAVPARLAAETRQLLEEEDQLSDAEVEMLWFMDYWNADGSVAEMCGNGVRAFANFLISEGLVELAEGEELPLVTRAGMRTVRRVPEGYAIGMGIWSFIDPELAQANASDSLVIAQGLTDPRPALSISLGNPHTVVALPEEEVLEALELHAAPQVDPVPPQGTNVEFVVPSDPLVVDGEGQVRMRVHERGVGETLSCGTGACAAAAAVRVWAAEDGVDTWTVQVPGGEVRVRFLARQDGAEDVELSGPAENVFAGTLA
ncbi:diaminopimelate epimerase [Nesterenkonia sp. HG001]|uniref:diaminopimelate epimerase n=1 Tax=Nesterenkonia sp. HG001 TaxID=2983207 RepID=UPI002AC3C8E2|nr:diaminopimelate epimerase [Nesterenkonia sp. HG001]MDZ5076057.1 diaminopimelate epimerase [Nesterenkonia sp. HG001]